MNITDIINRVLDTINRPSDNAIWSARATNAVNSAITKLYKKINFTIFKFEVQLTAPSNGVIDLLNDFTNIESVYDVTQKVPVQLKTVSAYLFSQLNQKTYPNIATVPYSESPTVYKTGVRLYCEPNHVYKIIGTVTQAQALASPEFEVFLENVADYVFYEALISMFILLNEDADRITMAKAFRDEAFLDVMTWNNSYDELGMRNIEG